MILGSLLIVATPHVFCAIMYLFFILSSVCSVFCLCQRTLCCILTYALCLPQSYMCVLYTYIVYMCVPSICVPFICCVSMYIFSILQSVLPVLCCVPKKAFFLHFDAWPLFVSLFSLFHKRIRVFSISIFSFHKRIRVCSISILSLNMCPLYVFPSYLVYLCICSL